MPDHVIVVTGMGPVSAVGIGRESFADALKNDACGLVEDSSFGGTAAEIIGFEVSDYLESDKPYLDRQSGFAMAASALALKDAGVSIAELDSASAGIAFGTAQGCLGTMDMFFTAFREKGPRFVQPFIFPHTYSNTTISLLAIEYGLGGHHVNYASGAVSSAYAIIEAAQALTDGRASVMLAGGADALSDVAVAQVGPGAMPGEGAGMFVLETRERAEARGAGIHGEILGSGISAGMRDDAAGFTTALSESMRLACERADVTPTEIDMLLTSSDGELASCETAAVNEVIGAQSADVVKSLRPMLGDLAGATTVLACTAALELLDVNGVAMINAVDAGGAIASIILRKV